MGLLGLLEVRAEDEEFLGRLGFRDEAMSQGFLGLRLLGLLFAKLLGLLWVLDVRAEDEEFLGRLGFRDEVMRCL